MKAESPICGESQSSSKSDFVNWILTSKYLGVNSRSPTVTVPVGVNNVVRALIIVPVTLRVFSTLVFLILSLILKSPADNVSPPYNADETYFNSSSRSPANVVVTLVVVAIF